MKRLLWLGALACSCALMAELTVVDKVADDRPVIPLPMQNEAIPEGAVADEFVESAPPIRPTAQEQGLQMVLFSRPLTEPIWPVTNPLPFERVEALSGWGARGQYVTLNFAVYPLAELKNLRVQVLDSAVRPEVRVVRYWNTVYPNYNSYRYEKVKRYRRMPEFLMPVTVCDAPAREPQRFCLTFRLPQDGTAAMNGRVLVSHDGVDKAVSLPFHIDVLPFELKQDPAKHYTAYYYQVREKSNVFFTRHQEDKALVHKVQVEEFRRMLEYGFTRAPIFNMSYGTRQDGKKNTYYIPYLDDFMAEMKEAGFDNKHEIPIKGCSGGWLYEKFTGHKLSSFHMENIECDRIPQALYDEMDKALTELLDYAKANNYPAMIFNPIDEPSSASFPYVTEIFRIFKRHGLKTFLTSPPAEFKEKADDLFDIYNYGAFHVPYSEATSGRKLEYWCYPNDNAYQIKDPYVMCHGGRMTYGLGYWRSGFRCIIPWIWRSNTEKRMCNSGGNLLWPEDGRVFMTTYWECFRLGVDDLRYIYTLEDAIVRRENSVQAAVQAAVRDGRAVLQKVWNATCPQPAYLRDNLLHHLELDALRAELAQAILRLKATPETQDKTAPSVIIDVNGKYDVVDGVASQQAAGLREVPLRKWQPCAQETTLKESEGRLDVRFAVDHKLVGEGYGGKVQYPMGWPRFRHTFGDSDRDLSPYTHLAFELTVSSNRDIQNDYSWPLSIGFKNTFGQEVEFKFASTLEPKVKHQIRIPLEKLNSFSRKGLANLAYVQIFISESNYPHGSVLDLQVENIRLQGFSQPTLMKLEAPRRVALPVTGIPVKAVIGGMKPETECVLKAELALTDGKVMEMTEAPIAEGKALFGFSGKALSAGEAMLRVAVVGKSDGRGYSEVTLPMTLVASPK